MRDGQDGFAVEEQMVRVRMQVLLIPRIRLDWRESQEPRVSHGEQHRHEQDAGQARKARLETGEEWAHAA